MAFPNGSRVRNHHPSEHVRAGPGRCVLVARVDIQRETATMTTILLIILILILIGALPTWGYSRAWGYTPSGLLGVVVVILLILMLMGRI